MAKFRANTGVSNLRKHLYKQHLQEWTKGCEALGIQITAKAAVEVIGESQGLTTEMKGEYLICLW